MMRSLLLAAALLPAAVVLAGRPTFASATDAVQAPTKTTNSGVYTAAQAERGKKVFSEKCTTCHEPSRFSGDAFTESWNGKALKEIWDVASGTMPEDNPGSLKQTEYADIIAYFLHLNEYPTGDAELAAGAAPMAAIKVEKKK
ncbi:MAG TPA: cytochrome c [Vicinamibacterales bacterium]|nr:cytochrome c [Vicinamibacterales bacterium]